MRKININLINIQELYLHCSDSEFGNAQKIEDWHKQRGWSDIGYHYTICNGIDNKNGVYLAIRDGAVEAGRDTNLVGSHVKGKNKNSLGIVLIGKNKFTQKQAISLINILKELLVVCPKLKIENIKGHCEVDSSKTCPNFKVEEIRNMLLAENEVFNG